MSAIRIKGPYTVDDRALYASTPNGRIKLADFGLENGLDASEQAQLAQMFAGIVTTIERRQLADMLPERRDGILSHAETEAVRASLQVALKVYRATMPRGLWSFTTAAMIYMADWLGLMQPKEARAFLMALADNAVAHERPAMEKAAEAIGYTRTGLLEVLEAPAEQ
jgi:hypothetical protein